MAWAEAGLQIWLHVLVLVLATARLVRLVRVDRITVGIRVRLVAKFGDEGKVGYFLTCPWCISIWAALPLVTVYTLWPNKWVMAVYLWLAISYVVGLLSQLERE